mmetsp:Transcript_699/g.1112  ORF Transcript_699/g.1112 Transcript_699/m.1112 type:complete len:476 (-) Transcript_699:81-1508(-)
MNRSDDDSEAAESWMDASIRLHMRQSENGAHTRIVHFNGNGNEDDHNGDEMHIEIISPPDTNELFESHEHHAHEYQYRGQFPLVVAEIVPNQTAENKVDHEMVSASAPPPPPEVPEDMHISRYHGEEEGRSSDVTKSTVETDTSSNPNQPQAPPTTHGAEIKRMVTGINTSDNKRRKKAKEKIFSSASVSKFIVARTSLPYTIEQSEVTLEWTAVLNTYQEAIDTDDFAAIEESAVSMTFKTLDEAREACHNFAPPRMHSFQDTPKCHICTKSYNKILRRQSHCKNCGVCVCTDCAVPWPKEMLPVTFHMHKRKKLVKVCMACDWLNVTFRRACVTGDLDKAVALNSTGNINTRTPFANMRGDHYYPVHCAVLGGNLAMLKWFIEILRCPINSSKRKSPAVVVAANFSFVGAEKVVSSRGKSVLDLAMEAQNLGILHYLIIEQGVSVMQYRNMRVALRTLETALIHIPAHLKETA